MIIIMIMMLSKVSPHAGTSKSKVSPHAGRSKSKLSPHAGTSKSKEYKNILFSKSESLKGVKENKKLTNFMAKLLDLRVGCITRSAFRC